MNEKKFTIKFSDLAWSAHCFYYRSVGDRKYCRIMSDTSFIQRLQRMPFEITPSEFEQKALLDYVNISSYDLLIEHKLAENMLEKILVYNLTCPRCKTIVSLSVTFQIQQLPTELKKFTICYLPFRVFGSRVFRKLHIY